MFNIYHSLNFLGAINDVFKRANHRALSQLYLTILLTSPPQGVCSTCVNGESSEICDLQMYMTLDDYQIYGFHYGSFK